MFGFLSGTDVSFIASCKPPVLKQDLRAFPCPYLYEALLFPAQLTCLPHACDVCRFICHCTELKQPFRCESARLFCSCLSSQATALHFTPSFLLVLPSLLLGRCLQDRMSGRSDVVLPFIQMPRSSQGLTPQGTSHPDVSTGSGNLALTCQKPFLSLFLSLLMA